MPHFQLLKAAFFMLTGMILLSLCPVCAQAPKASPMIKQIITRFALQQKLYGQEKLYLHTDKAFYLAGENIWYQAYLVDAAKHMLSDKSRFVYVELIDRTDSVLVRQKLRKDSINGFYGNIPISKLTLSGKYQLRAYTIWMQNAGEDYFFRKEIVVDNPFPVSESDTVLTACHKFILERDSVRWTQKIQPSLNTKNNAPDLQFFPEGGHLISGRQNVVAFKAIDTNGLSVEVEGEIRDSLQNKITGFKSDYKGMGRFILPGASDERYTAVAKTPDGRIIRVHLPLAAHQAISLRTKADNDKLVYFLDSGDSVATDQKRFLIIHQRGKLIRLEEINHLPKIDTLNYSGLADGIIHLLLTDESGNPLTERLAFIQNKENQIPVGLEVRQDTSSVLNLALHVSDVPGSYSVSVTQADIPLGNKSGISGSLLLGSDLRGYIEEPESYFAETLKDRITRLDNLMLTQGWSRFDVAKLVQGKSTLTASYPIEKGQLISGSVTDKKGCPAVNIPVSITGFKSGIFEVQNTDAKGRYLLQSISFRDSTRFVMKPGEKWDNKYRLTVDWDTFPEVHVGFPNDQIHTASVDYDKIVVPKMPNPDNLKIVNLQAVTVSANKWVRPKSKFYMTKMADRTFDESILKDYSNYTLQEVLAVLCPFIMYNATEDSPTVRDIATGEFLAPALLVNEFKMEWPDFARCGYYARDIESIDIFRGVVSHIVANTDPSKSGAVIAVMLKKQTFESRPSDVQLFYPLGWLKPKDFYVPKYETAEEKEGLTPYKTIYWSAKVNQQGLERIKINTDQVKIGRIRIVVEGISEDGRIISFQRDVK